MKKSGFRYWLMSLVMLSLCTLGTSSLVLAGGHGEAASEETAVEEGTGAGVAMEEEGQGMELLLPGEEAGDEAAQLEEAMPVEEAEEAPQH